jgi:hypothetical protein
MVEISINCPLLCTFSIQGSVLEEYVVGGHEWWLPEMFLKCTEISVTLLTAQWKVSSFVI